MTHCFQSLYKDGAVLMHRREKTDHRTKGDHNSGNVDRQITVR